MHRRSLQRSIRKYERRIRQSARGAAVDADTIHFFRTNVKKLRAVLRWLGKREKILPEDFKEIYHVSGQLRDVQVLLKAVEEDTTGLPAFTDWLRVSVTRLQQLWNDSDTGTAKHLRDHIDKQPLKSPGVRRLQSFFRDGIRRIKAIVYLPAPTDENLHEIRKVLKDMHYVYEWGIKNGLTDNEDEKPEALKNLGNDAGKFNDRRIGLILLTAYSQQEQDAAALEAARALRLKWEDDRNRRRDRLLRALRQFAERNSLHTGISSI